MRESTASEVVVSLTENRLADLGNELSKEILGVVPQVIKAMCSIH